MVQTEAIPVLSIVSLSYKRSCSKHKNTICSTKRTAYLLRVCVLFATISPEYDKTGFAVNFLVLSYRNAENFILQ